MSVTDYIWRAENGRGGETKASSFMVYVGRSNKWNENRNERKG